MDTFTHPTGDGAKHSFAHLTLYDVFGDPKKPGVNGFVPLYRKRLKSELIENLKTSVEAGFIDKEQGLIELQNFDAHHKKEDPLKAFLDYIREAPESLRELVSHAYAQANGGKELPELPPGDYLHEVFWKLVEPFDIRPAPAEPDPKTKTATYGEADESPNPPAPPTYSTTLETAATTAADGATTGIAHASA